MVNLVASACIPSRLVKNGSNDSVRNWSYPGIEGCTLSSSLVVVSLSLEEEAEAESLVSMASNRVTMELRRARICGSFVFVFVMMMMKFGEVWRGLERFGEVWSGTVDIRMMLCEFVSL